MKPSWVQFILKPDNTMSKELLDRITEQQGVFEDFEQKMNDAESDLSDLKTAYAKEYFAKKIPTLGDLHIVIKGIFWNHHPEMILETEHGRLIIQYYSEPRVEPCDRKRKRDGDLSRYLKIFPKEYMEEIECAFLDAYMG